MTSDEDDEPIVITVVVASDEMHEAEAAAQRTIAAVRGVTDGWGVLNEEVARVVTAILGDEADPLEAVARRIAYAVAGYTMVGAFATNMAASAVDADPLDIDLIIQQALENLE